MKKMEGSFLRAIDNIASHGDTDVFPYPIENTIFYDKKSDIVNLLIQINKTFDDCFYTDSPFNESQLSPVGYNGFRWCTQFDAIWNAYLLGITLALSEQIESARIPIEEETIFSYRFQSGTDEKLFKPNIGWHEFHRKSLELAENYNTIIICDISDFYHRVRHHRLENALKHLPNVSDIPKKIISLLSNFSGTNSHGLPIGGPAARLLSELILNSTDSLLRSEGIKFCRFADDYHLFCNSEEDAYDTLLFLSKKLLNNEGLVLQKSKTRVMSSSEFKNTSPFSQTQDEIKIYSPQAFLSISLRYDPYSPSAESDYFLLKSEVEKFDILGFLRKEIAKTKIDLTFTRQIIKALKFLSPSIREQAVVSICNSMNTLYPIFPTLMIVLKDIWDDLSPQYKELVGQSIRSLFLNKSRIVKTEINQSYACRLLAKQYCQENIELFQKLFSSSESSFIKRDIMLAMFNWRYIPWISDLKNQYRGFTPPLRRAFIICSYSLGDEGKHWRSYNSKNFSEFEKIVQAWASEKAQVKKEWVVPL